VKDSLNDKIQKDGANNPKNTTFNYCPFGHNAPHFDYIAKNSCGNHLSDGFTYYCGYG
jgi:hypothetical protein